VTSAPPETPTPQRRRIAPERRRRVDVYVAVALVVLIVAGAAFLWATSPEVATVDTPDATPIAAPTPAGDVPTAFGEAWRAPSSATTTPVVAGPAVVTGDETSVTGHDAETGNVAWTYRRDVTLCALGSAFPGADDGDGHVLALYESRTGWCSELTALHPASGRRADASNPDMQPGVQMVANGSYVTATGNDYLEVWRSDLVRTLEYGNVPTPVQPGKQPRPTCTYGSTAAGTNRIGVIERCPEADTDRLTVLTPDGPKGADTPDVQFSVELPAAGAVLVALADDRVAVALPNPARLVIYDRAGLQVSQFPLDLPDSALTTAPAGAPADVTSDGAKMYWSAGGTTVALDATQLTPLWTLHGTLGPPVLYGTGLLAPVQGGLADLDPTRGTILRTLPVERAEPTAPVRLAAAGEILLEQRAGDLVALRPVD
jgi:outer membrane protein assembly factor BamB